MCSFGSWEIERGERERERVPDLGSFSGDWNAIKDTTLACAGVVCWILGKGLWFRCQKTTWLTSFNFCMLCLWQAATDLGLNSKALCLPVIFSAHYSRCDCFCHISFVCCYKKTKTYSSCQPKLLYLCWINVVSKAQIDIGKSKWKIFEFLLKYLILFAHFGIVKNMSASLKSILKGMWDL